MCQITLQGGAQLFIAEKTLNREILEARELWDELVRRRGEGITNTAIDRNGEAVDIVASLREKIAHGVHYHDLDARFSEDDTRAELAFNARVIETEQGWGRRTNEQRKAARTKERAERNDREVRLGEALFVENAAHTQLVSSVTIGDMSPADRTILSTLRSRGLEVSTDNVGHVTIHCSASALRAIIERQTNTLEEVGRQMAERERSDDRGERLLIGVETLDTLRRLTGVEIPDTIEQEREQERAIVARVLNTPDWMRGIREGYAAGLDEAEARTAPNILDERIREQITNLPRETTAVGSIIIEQLGVNNPATPIQPQALEAREEEIVARLREAGPDVAYLLKVDGLDETQVGSFVERLRGERLQGEELHAEILWDDNQQPIAIEIDGPLSLRLASRPASRGRG